jgi:small redox-active disulfide protein 2
MKKIEILGAGCPSLTKFYDMTVEAAGNLGLECEIKKIQDMNRIMKYDVVSIPALVIDGQVKIAGRLPSQAEIREFLSA